MKNNYSNLKANIFEIQRFCIHNGYGIRTNVFFKGCSLGAAIPNLNRTPHKLVIIKSAVSVVKPVKTYVLSMQSD
ncbi:MAG: hypothetical protein PWP62_2403 [Eubacteriaceae bacterium]|jgi:hypothetical protein|nr:hypothetical protein [Eubacteriaceae bacterium]